MSGYSSSVPVSLGAESRGRQKKLNGPTLPKRRAHARPKSEYAVYLSVAYPVLLVAACLLRLMPGGPKFQGVEYRRPSVFREAWEMGQSALPWVFSGR